MGGLGAPEIILLLFVSFLSIVPAILGYILGKTRTIGTVGGMLLGFFFSLLGVLVIYFIPQVEDDVYYSPNYLSPADELKKFKDLLDSGAITEAEYHTQKARILSR